MTNVLLLNVGKSFYYSQGSLNQQFADHAQQHSTHSGVSVQRTNIEQGYDIQSEIEKFVWADVIIYQQPAWRMGAPSTLKKYIDEVFTEGHGVLYHNDVRLWTRSPKKASKLFGAQVECVTQLSQGTFIATAAKLLKRSCFLKLPQFLSKLSLENNR